MAVRARCGSPGVGPCGADFSNIGDGERFVVGVNGPEFLVVLEVVAAAVAFDKELMAVGVAAVGVEVTWAYAPKKPLEFGQGEEIVFGDDGLEFHVAAGRGEVEGNGCGGVHFGEELAGKDADTGAGIAESDKAQLRAEFPVEPHLFGDGAAVVVAKAAGDGLSGGWDLNEERGLEVVEVIALKEVISTGHFIKGQHFDLDDLTDFIREGLGFGIDKGPVGELDF